MQDQFPFLPLPDLAFATNHPTFGATACLIAGGPLAWSVIVLQNALVLHDADHYSSTFIHLWPIWTTLSLRMHKAAVAAVLTFTPPPPPQR